MLEFCMVSMKTDHCLWKMSKAMLKVQLPKALRRSGSQSCGILLATTDCGMLHETAQATPPQVAVAKGIHKLRCIAGSAQLQPIWVDIASMCKVMLKPDDVEIYQIYVNVL